MKYTFLLPAFKGRYLDEMLRSIKAQTYTDFKVLISDDCSPEDLRSICEPYLSDPRFTYRRNEENMGSKSLVSHWNMLVDMCDTPYLIMASDDDVYEPQFLEEIDALVQKYPDVDLFRGRACKIDGNGKRYMCDGDMKSKMDQEEFVHLIYQYSSFVSCIANFVYKRKSLLEKDKFIDFPLAWFSDEATNIMMSQNGCCMTPNIVFGFRKSSTNISSKWGDREDCIKKTKATISFNKWMRDYMKHLPFSNLKNMIETEYKAKVYGNIQNHIYHCPIAYFIQFLLLSPNDVGLNKPRMLVHYIVNKIK